MKVSAARGVKPRLRGMGAPEITVCRHIKCPAIKTRRRARREERRKELCRTLFQPFGDPVLSNAIISLVFFKTGVMPSGVDAGDSGRPAPHAIIKHGVACVGVCADKIFK